MLTRRTFAKVLSAGVATLLAGRRADAQGSPFPAEGKLLLTSGGVPTALATDFVGLGYEESSVAMPGLFSAENTAHVRLLRMLPQPCVLRLGGIVADATAYLANGTPRHEPGNTVITRACLQQLRGFLDAVDARAIWSVNFGRGTLPEAIAEARDVSATLGRRLLAIELGNEVENYGRGNAPLRTPPYTYDTWRAEYSRWRTAILAEVPGLAFAAPDTAASVEWVERLAADARGEVQLLTTHYYRGDQRRATREQILSTDAKLIDTLQRLQKASHASGIPWRMCEINSFFGGGHPGISDTLAGALWTLDTMLLLASYGCAGVNMETGYNQLGFLSSYSPIRNDETGNVTVGAPLYGMVAFGQATAGMSHVLPWTVQGEEVNATAYVLGSADRPRGVVLINRSADRALRVSLQPLGLREPVVSVLTGPSLDGTTGITLGGDTLDPTRAFHPHAARLRRDEVVVAPGTAAVVRERNAPGSKPLQ